MKTIGLLLCMALCLSGALVNQVNDDKPQKGEYVIPMTQLWSIQGVNQGVFSGPPSVTVDEDGRIFVYNFREGVNHILDGNGQWLRSFSKRGEGPGEIKRQHDLFLAGGKVNVCDDDRLHRFSLTGEYIDSIPFRYLGNPISFFIDGEHFVSSNAVNATQAQANQGGGIYLNTMGRPDVRRLIRNYTVFNGSSIVSGQRRMVMLIEFLTPLMTMAWDGERIYYGMNNGYRINMCDLEGKDLGFFSLNRSNRPMSLQDKRTFFEGRQNITEELLKTLPEEQTQFVRMQVLKNHLLVFVTDALRSGKQQIDVFDKNGCYLYRMVMKAPEGTEFMRPQRFNPVLSGDFAYLVLEDEDGEITLQKFRMELPF